MGFDARVTEFSGISGRVLRQTVSAASLISGFVLSFVIFLSAWVLTEARAPGAISPVIQIVLALALARFAVNGLYGEWNGTIFSTRGGSWAAVSLVAVRYLVLTAVWLVPLMVLSPGEEEIAKVIAMGPAAAGRLLAVIAVYVLAFTLTPPVSLIVATRVDSFGGMFEKQTWSDLFRGRLGDLFTIYAVYTGGVGMVLVLSIPFVLLAFVAGKPPGFLMAFAAFCLLMGLSANLLGRLCGFFAFGEADLDAPTMQPTPVDAGPARPAHPAPGLEQATEPATFSAIDTNPASAPAMSSTAAPPIASASSPAAPAGVAMAATAKVEPQAEPRDKRPPLLEAAERVDALMKRWDEEPQVVLDGLQDLYTSYAPSPQVLHAYCIGLHRAGDAQRALQLAHEALPLCFERGNSRLAARIFREFRESVEALKLGRDQTVTIANAAYKMGDLATASRAYSRVLAADPGDVRAVKGLLQVADDILQKKNKPAVAEPIFRYLVNHCSASPLAEYMRQGLDEAERRQRQAD